MATSRLLSKPQRAQRSVPIVPLVGHFSISVSPEASPARRPTSATFQTSARSCRRSANRSLISLRPLSRVTESPIRGWILRRAASCSGFLDECAADPSVLLVAYDLSTPEIVRRLESFGPRLRIVVDDSDKHGKPASDESNAAKRLAVSAGISNVARHHFSGLQHNKVIIARRKSGNASEPFAVATGSTNFSLGGLYIQNNNVLLFRDADVARLYAEVFDAAFPKATGFSGKPIAKQWFEKALPDAGTYRFCFSPHKKAALSMNPVAEAIEGAKKSVFYAIAFRGAQTGPADTALDALDPEKMLVMGVANMAGKPKSQTLMVQLPGRGPIPFGPAALTKNLPEPFKAEWTGGGGIHMHHKFVICDFNGSGRFLVRAAGPNGIGPRPGS